MSGAVEPPAKLADRRDFLIAAPAANAELSAAASGEKADRRIYAWWSLALGLLALLGVFCWFFLRPYLEVRAAVERCAPDMWPGLHSELAKLGGGEAAAPKIAFYLHLPESAAPHQETAVWMLSLCGRHGSAAMMRRAVDRDDRAGGTACILLREGYGRPGMDLLQARIKDANPRMRLLAAQILGLRDSPQAAELLTEALSDQDLDVRSAAAEGLRFIDTMKKARGDRTGSPPPAESQRP